MKLLCSALCGIFLLLHCADGVYQPECDSLDTAIDTIQQSFQQVQAINGLDSASINCTKKTDCDGFTCILGFQDQKTEMTVELKPCEEPPQMFILMQDVDGDVPFVEQTVSHGDSFLIPGLQYRYGFIVMQAALGVQFQNDSGGLRIGLSLDFYAARVKVFSVPLLPSTVIKVPACTTTGVDDQCAHMETLVDSLDPPHDFSCAKNPDCKGFNCTGVIRTTFSVNLAVLAKLVIDSCKNPVSFEISVGPPDSPPTGVGVFRYSENQQLDIEGLPPGLTTDLNVTMIPYTQDIDYIRTTIEVIFCYPGVDCMHEVFIDNALVPIPPCDNPRPSATPGSNVPTTPLPGSADECTTMTEIAAEIENNEYLQPDSINCHHNGPCDGIECTINTRPNPYIISMQLFHCDDPVRLHVVIDIVGVDDDGDGFPEEYDIDHDQSISIDEIMSDASLKFHLVKRASDEVELALLLKLETSSQSVYLINDRIVPVGPCSTPTGMIPTGMMTTKKIGLTTGTPKPKVTTKKPNGKFTKVPKNDAKKDPQKDQQSNSASIGIGVGIAALIAVVVIILVGVWYHRRNRSSTDHLALMENSSAPI